MRSGIWRAFAFAASVLVADGFSAVGSHGVPWAAILTARSGKRLSFKTGGEYPEKVKLKVTLIDPDGNRNELPSLDLDINGPGRYLGPEIPRGSGGLRVKLEILDAQTGAFLSAAGSVAI